MYREILLSAAWMSASETMHEKGIREVMMITIKNDSLILNMIIAKKCWKKFIEW